jgi:hypothetical protein
MGECSPPPAPSPAQTQATLATMAALERLLGFVSAHRDGQKVLLPSEMQLGVLSDASYFSRPNAGSVTGSFHHLCRLRDPGFVNAPILVHSAGIPIVCSSVPEAEYSSIFGAARIATGERQVLHDLGYPQRPVIYCDNEVAVGLANRSVKQKLCKSCDMRLHWLRDRVAQLQILVRHIPGSINVADFFTQARPLPRHKALAPFVASDHSTVSCRPRLNFSLA